MRPRLLSLILLPTPARAEPAPGEDVFIAKVRKAELRLDRRCGSRQGEAARLCGSRTRSSKKWELLLRPAAKVVMRAARPDEAVVTAVGRTGVESEEARVPG